MSHWQHCLCNKYKHQIGRRIGALEFSENFTEEVPLILCLWKLLESLHFCASLLFLCPSVWILHLFFSYQQKAEVSKSNEEKKKKNNLKKIIRDKKQWFYKDAFYNIFFSLFQNSLFLICCFSVLHFYTIRKPIVFWCFMFLMVYKKTTMGNNGWT